MAVAVVVVTGCGGTHRYDGRLVAADSLMQPAPDSALAALTAIDTLAGESDRAYRDLLVTQARYKCYADITASDDNAITRAMGYYRAHSSECEKLTRAFLYKGAVMEELGHVDSAMFYYKTAEATAAPKDYPNLGQINTRIARLFRDYYADPQICYDKYEQALTCYKRIGNKRLQFNCLVNMGGCSGITRIGNPEKLLAQATQLAIELNDSSKIYKSQELLCRQLAFEGGSIVRAKQVALHCLNNFRSYVNNDLLLDLADIYAYSHCPDSARYFIELVDEHAKVSNSEQIKARKYLILSKITRLEGDSVLSAHYNMLSYQISDSALNNEQKYRIQQIENDQNLTQVEQRRQTIHRQQNWIMGIILTAVIVLAAWGCFYYRKMRYINSIIQELRCADINRHEELLEQVISCNNEVDSQNDAISQFIGKIVSFMQTTIDSSNHDSPTVIRKRVREEIGNVTANEEFWKALRTHVNNTHDDLITRLAQNPKITEQDLRFIELSCCGFNYVEIAIIMGYRTNYISQKRKTIATKLHIKMPLQEYLDNAIQQD